MGHLAPDVSARSGDRLTADSGVSGSRVRRAIYIRRHRLFLDWSAMVVRDVDNNLIL